MNPLKPYPVKTKHNNEVVMKYPVKIYMIGILIKNL